LKDLAKFRLYNLNREHMEFLKKSGINLNSTTTTYIKHDNFNNIKQHNKTHTIL